MTILNLTQHAATPAQKDAGVVDLDTHSRAMLGGFLTFNNIPKKGIIQGRSDLIVSLVKASGHDGVKTAMIGGAPFLMGDLERALIEAGIKPVYAFSKRVSVDIHQPDGTVKKALRFEHLGFVDDYL